MKINKSIIILLFIFSIISIITIYSSNNILPLYYKNLYIKQIIWYILGFIILFIFFKLDIKKIYDNIFLIYMICNILLLFLLLFAKPINGARCWFQIGSATFQPSELMKFILIILISKEIDKNEKKDLKLLFKIFIIVLIPSILTFLEPDTGNVIIYFLIAFIMLLISIKKRWIIIICLLMTLIIGFILLNINTFKNILKDDFFLRINRLLDWKNQEGYQLEKSITSIGSSGLFGYGIKNNPIYFPESHTDFIFSIFSTSFGFIGSLLLIILFIIFDYKLLIISKKVTKYNYIIIGICSMLIFQQFQNIGMTIGLLPITGITLPFISYGGTNLIILMASIGLILNIEKKYKKM